MTDDAKRIYQWEQVCKLRTMERDAALSALSVAEKRAEDWKDAALGFQAVLKETRADRGSSQASLLRVREALEFYANPWAYKDKHGEPVRVPDFYDEMEFGDIARTALSPHTEK